MTESVIILLCLVVAIGLAIKAVKALNDDDNWPGGNYGF